MTESAATLRFRGRIRMIGVNPYVLLSAARARRLKPGWRKPLPVLVRINSEPQKKPWRINLMPVGSGAFYLYLHGDVRRASASQVGDTVDVELALDSAYRGGPAQLPAWFQRALRENARASRAFKALSPSRQKEIVRYLRALKSEAARARNLTRALAVLGGKKERFMGRAWQSGS